MEGLGVRTWANRQEELTLIGGQLRSVGEKNVHRRKRRWARQNGRKVPMCEDKYSSTSGINKKGREERGLGFCKSVRLLDARLSLLH